MARRTLAIPHTYELYLTDRAGNRRFEALTCHPVDLSSRAREALAREPIVAVEVREMGAHLFTLGSDAAGADYA